MKLSKETNGAIKLTEDNDDFILSVANAPFLHKHKYDSNVLFFSEDASPYNIKDKIMIDVTKVTNAFGSAFVGNREDLAKLLSENF